MNNWSFCIVFFENFDENRGIQNPGSVLNLSNKSDIPVRWVLKKILVDY